MPIIAVSRMSFAAGRDVAKGVAKELGLPCLSREEALVQAAQECGILESELVRALNQPPHFWQQVPGKRLAYMKCVTAVLLDRARQGNLVYHGHVGHLLLSAIPHVLRVRVIADMESRIRSAMARVTLKREAAIAHIHHVDEDRARWARFLYGVDWQEPTQYHLILNLGQLSVASACGTIACMAEMEEFRPSAEGLRQLEDLRIGCKVWAALARNPDTRSAAIQVTAHEGEVVISGTVPSAAFLETITKIATQVEGVTSVRCTAGMGTDWYW